MDPDNVLWLMDAVLDEAKRESLFGHPEYVLPYAEALIRQKRIGIVNNPEHVCTRGNCRMQPETIVLYQRQRPAGPDVMVYDQSKKLPVQRDAGASIDHETSPSGQLVVMEKQNNRSSGTLVGTLVLAAEDFVKLAIEHAPAYCIHVCIPDVCEHLVKGHKCDDPSECPHGSMYRGENIKHVSNVFSCISTGNLHICGAKCTQRTTNFQMGGLHVCPLTGVVLGAQLVNIQETYQPSTSGQLYLKADAYENVLSTDQINARMVEKLINDLLFSRDRQVLEWNNFKNAFVAPIITMVSGLTKKRHIPSHRDYSALTETMYTLRPCSNYFSQFGVVDASILKNGDEHASRIIRNNHRIMEIIRESQTVVSRPVEPEYESDKMTIAKAVVHMYHTLVAYCGKNQELLTKLGSFKSSYARILYMMQIGYTVPIVGAGKSSVSVIPRFPLLQALPAQRDLRLYIKINADVHHLISKKKVDKIIVDIITHRVKMGSVYDMEFEKKET